MKWFLLAILLVSNVYGSEELLQCYDGCLNAFRYETNAYPDMPRERLTELADITKRCCIKCEHQFEVIICHNRCNDIHKERMSKTKSVSEQMDIAGETRGCHSYCDFIADLKRGYAR